MPGSGRKRGEGSVTVRRLLSSVAAWTRASNGEKFGGLSSQRREEMSRRRDAMLCNVEKRNEKEHVFGR